VRVDGPELDAYLARIGAARPARADATALRELQVRHLLAVPFENLSIHLGERIVLEPGALRPAAARDYEVTPEGERLLGGLGVDVAGLRRQRRAFARGCLDWTERTPHLSGALGAALLERLLGLGWLARGRVPRGLVLTDAGRDGLAVALACHVPTRQPGAHRRS